jgi:succinyl-CoA synthetase beta subunit
MARERGLNYVKLDGDVGNMTNDGCERQSANE